MKWSSFSLALLLLLGCSGRSPVERVEWPAMGTVAAVQIKHADSRLVASGLAVARGVCEDANRLLNAHDPSSRIRQLAVLTDADAVLLATNVFASGGDAIKSCVAAAFALKAASGGAFDPRWKGPDTLDLGAIAKGFAVDVIASEASFGDSGQEVLVDIGGNLKCQRGHWRTGVKDPHGAGLAATVTLRSGEALATSAEYFRGKHIYDGRTGRPVSNDVASVTVLCESAMMADGLSTTLFVLGHEEGKAFLEKNRPGLLRTAGEKVSALWILKNGTKVVWGDARF